MPSPALGMPAVLGRRKAQTTGFQVTAFTVSTKHDSVPNPRHTLLIHGHCWPLE